MRLPIPLMMLITLIVTIIIEIIVAVILKVKNKKDYINIILVNIITNPIVAIVPFYINIHYGVTYRNISLVLMEIWAVVLEGYLYKKYLQYGRINGYILSFILNVSSYLIGTIINYIIY